MQPKSAIASAFAGAVLISATFLSAQSPDPAVPYPSEYRTWVMVKSYVVTPESKTFKDRGGFHHYYANDKALVGYRTGEFPEGSMIVDEGVGAKDVDGVTIETDLRNISLMHKDARYTATGGWGYEVFEGGNTVGTAGAKTQGVCYGCHPGAKDRDYVFSTSRIATGSRKQ